KLGQKSGGVNRKRASKREYEINFHRSVAGGRLLAAIGRTPIAKGNRAHLLTRGERIQRLLAQPTIAPASSRRTREMLKRAANLRV
ncbi:MAG: hypothetical protein WCE42_34745, partial [Rhizobium ruizarguesonis]